MDTDLRRVRRVASSARLVGDEMGDDLEGSAPTIDRIPRFTRDSVVGLTGFEPATP